LATWTFTFWPQNNVAIGHKMVYPVAHFVGFCEQNTITRSSMIVVIIIIIMSSSSGSCLVVGV